LFHANRKVPKKWIEIRVEGALKLDYKKQQSHVEKATSELWGSFQSKNHRGCLKKEVINMSIVRKALIMISGNLRIQKLLERNLLIAEYLMGIGSGGDVFNSGENAIFKVLKNLGNPPYCIFDVGANNGSFTKLAISKLQNEPFSIHCFEPSQEAFKKLTQDYLRDKRIKLNNVALGRARGCGQLYYDASGSGIASLTKRKLDHFGIAFDKSETVKIETIDNYSALNDINRIHLLKMDIEGHELDALSGAKMMFDKKLVDIVTFEFGGCNIDTRTFLQDFWYFFNQVGMTLFRITPSSYLYPIQSYKEIDEQFRTTNFLASKVII
jgi:FkbM family methyltransferase